MLRTAKDCDKLAARVVERGANGSLAAMTGYENSPDYGEPEDAWKTDLLAVLVIFAFAVVAVLAF